MKKEGESMFKDMQAKLKDTGISPIFFVGSGISRRYIGSPDWMGLLEEIVRERDVNFTKLIQKYTDSEGKVNNEDLAQELESIYFDSLADDEIKSGGSKPYYFRKRIADITELYLQESIPSLQSNPEIIELKKTSPAAIITTNYDRLLQEVFGKEYTVLIGQNSLLENVVDGVGEIYKIHGCSSEPNSIVITKKDYDNFFEKNKYLNAKLLTLFLEYPIVFMGYSISDRNIISILSTIFEMLSPEKIDELKSRMWFVEPNDKNKKTEVRINLNEGNYMDITSFKLSDYSLLYKAISDVSIKRLPIRFLKYLKSNTYKLVASQEYNPKLLNVNIEDIESIENFDGVNQFVGLTFSTDRTIGFCNNNNICEAFLKRDSREKYDQKDLLAYREKNKIPFYKFCRSLSQEQMLECIDDVESDFYKQLKNDDFNYKISIGKQQSVNYTGEISQAKIEQYAPTFVTENNLQSNQEGTVIRYVILQLINQDISKVITADFVADWKNEVVRVMTQLSDDFIKANEKSVFNLIEALHIDIITEHNFRYLLCLVDRALYRR